MENLNYDNYICGTRFRDLADFIFDSSKYELITNNLHMEGKPFYVVYCHTHEFMKIIGKLIWLYKHKIVLITHNSDGAVRDSRQGQEIREHDADVSLLPPNVVKWYAQNVECDYDPDKIVPIPIGLENRYCFDYDKAKMLFDKNISISPTKEFYLNCNIHTNLAERTPCYEACKNLPNSTVRLAGNGNDYDRYLNEIIDHKYIVSPRGNGLDCHRTYEALYLGRIPVRKYEKSLISMHLPTVWIDDWNNIEYTKYSPAYSLQMPCLDINYWKERIHNAN